MVVGEHVEVARVWTNVSMVFVLVLRAAPEDSVDLMAVVVLAVFALLE